ncbi:Pex12 amino terminal region-domain-containing protein [Syncephalis pseudoplumigaleata]|uniref:Peroxisome assembly protein 12 n=1 Tax=Syncephalis pseudoplumigaleata TaxID=1712513 RepID=A0A4V1J1V6_9FUNG|nr:Pex12 amino terminal region-domain-containing protein [Syncephalis pseudoplumigaleata]|eukprot:RKP26389.1 Pex12 amino terminal region-domain-containing protein [Syncephalis pseudoplumigaleata]
MEFMSNISGGDDSANRPSLFELIAQDQMRDLLRPALRYLVTYYAERYPRYLLRVHRHFDEVLLFVSWLVERHYLRQWQSSFSENFYGLKRARVADHGRQWTGADVRRSLLYLVGLPYLKTKLDAAYEQARGGAAADLFDEEEPDALCIHGRYAAKTMSHYGARLFRTMYPWINAAYHGSILVYQVAYLYDKTRFYSPWLHLQHVEVQRMTMQDYVIMAPSLLPSSRLLIDFLQQQHYKKQEEAAERFRQARLHSNGLSIVLLRHWLLRILGRGLDWLKIILPLGMFFFKFLEWWYASDYHKRAQQRPIPPPPARIQPSPNGLPLPVDQALCPICLKLRTNPAALPTGYAFCYPCIFHVVEEHGHCPITLAPVEQEQIRKLYTSGI